MKKLIVMLMLTLFSIGAYAQTQQGQSSFGFNLGYNFNDVGNATIGIDYRYCVTDAFRLTPDRKSTRLNSSHMPKSRMPSSA